MWWASVTGLWRSARYRFDPETAREVRRADLNVGFAVAQVLLLPFVADQPVLLLAVGGPCRRDRRLCRTTALPDESDRSRRSSSA